MFSQLSRIASGHGMVKSLHLALAIFRMRLRRRSKRALSLTQTRNIICPTLVEAPLQQNATLRARLADVFKLAGPVRPTAAISAAKQRRISHTICCLICHLAYLEVRGVHMDFTHGLAERTLGRSIS